MHPYWRYLISPLVVGSAIALSRFATSPLDDVAAATLPKDACSLLKPAEIQAALGTKDVVPIGVPATNMLPIGVECTYRWGPRTSGWGQTSLTVTVIDATKAWPGTSAEVLEEGLAMKVKAAGPNAKASAISGVGDAAAFTFESRSHDATVEAYFKSKAEHLSIMFHEGNSDQDKDKLIALLKQAAARL